MRHADSVYGSNITIPSMLISNTHGMALIEFIKLSRREKTADGRQHTLSSSLMRSEVKEGGAVVVKISGQIDKTNTVVLELTASPVDPMVTSFLKDFAPIALELKHKVLSYF